MEALYQVVPMRQQEARQARAGIPALLALPTLDPDRVDALFVLRLAMVVPVPDQTVCLATGWAALRSQALNVFPLGCVLLYIDGKIGYNDGG